MKEQENMHKYFYNPGEVGEDFLNTSPKAEFTKRKTTRS